MSDARLAGIAAEIARLDAEREAITHAAESAQQAAIEEARRQETAEIRAEIAAFNAAEADQLDRLRRIFDLVSAHASGPRTIRFGNQGVMWQSCWGRNPDEVRVWRERMLPPLDRTIHSEL